VYMYFYDQVLTDRKIALFLIIVLTDEPGFGSARVGIYLKNLTTNFVFNIFFNAMQSEFAFTHLF
jgi:hypothetical protein